MLAGRKKKTFLAENQALLCIFVTCLTFRGNSMTCTHTWKCTILALQVWFSNPKRVSLYLFILIHMQNAYMAFYCQRVEISTWLDNYTYGALFLVCNFGQVRLGLHHLHSARGALAVYLPMPYTDSISASFMSSMAYSGVLSSDHPDFNANFKMPHYS